MDGTGIPGPIEIWGGVPGAIDGGLGPELPGTLPGLDCFLNEKFNCNANKKHKCK